MQFVAEFNGTVTKLLMLADDKSDFAVFLKE